MNDLIITIYVLWCSFTGKIIYDKSHLEKLKFELFAMIYLFMFFMNKY